MQPGLLKSIVGGFVGTIVMTTMMMFVAPRMLGQPMDIAHLLAEFIGGPWILGMVIHFALGAVVFPLVYVFIFFQYLPGVHAVKGVLWGVLLWILAMVVVMPILGQGLFMSQGLGPKGAVAALVVHLVYGVLFGAIAGKPVRR